MSADFAEPASDEAVDAIRLGYTFAEPVVELGVLSVDDVPIRMLESASPSPC